MENRGNTLLALPLESTEILEEVNLSTDPVAAVTNNNVDNVGEMLIDENAQTVISGMESNSIDFEFVNTDLGNSTDFTMDNSSVFGITDSGVNAREDCEYLLRDSACFDDSINRQSDAGTLQESGMAPVPSSGKTNVYKDLGLQLQVIPLNNLQYVSTIQTNKGLHILAIPAQTALTPNYNEVTFHQSGEKSKQCFGNKIIPSLESSMQAKLKVPGLEMKSREATADVRKTILKSRTSLKGSLLSKSTRKKRNSLDRSLIICRNSNSRKSYIHKFVNKSGLTKQGKDKKVYVDVMKTSSSKKHRMVSLLNTSVTNKLKQHQTTPKLNTGGKSSQEIKVTFHLKQSKISVNSSRARLSSGLCTKALSDDADALKTIESHCSNTQRAFELDKSDKSQTSDKVTNVTSHEGNITVLEVIESAISDINENRQTMAVLAGSEQTRSVLDETEHSRPFLERIKYTKPVLEGNEQTKPDLEGNEHIKKGLVGNKHTKTVLEGNDHTKPALVRNEHTDILEIHNKTLENKTLETERTMSALTARNKYKCEICLSAFSRQGHFKNHMKTHKEMSIEYTKESFESKTEIPSKQFKEKSSQVNQKFCKGGDNHEEEMSLSSFVDLQKASQKRDKILTCEFCEMEFKSQGNLRRHKLIHSVETERKIRGRYDCDKCNKSFMQKCDLKRHVIIHSGAYQHTCSVCQKGFIRKSDLIVHEKFHTQEKQFRCKLCAKAYFQTGDLSRHMRQKHSELCKFACQECGKKYSTQKALNLHSNTKHG